MNTGRVADLTGDCTVNINDVLALLAARGTLDADLKAMQRRIASTCSCSSPTGDECPAGAAAEYNPAGDAMNLKSVNVICYTTAIICIVAGIVLALVLIWGDLDQEFVWKSLLTFAVLFLGSTLTLSINKLLERPPASS